MASLVTLQAGASGGPRVVSVPGAGATVADFLPLVAALGPQVEVLGIQPGRPHSTVESAAREHAGVVEALDPRSGVHLVGHSYGGWIAFEMALRLRCPVLSVTLLDTAAPDPDATPARRCIRSDGLRELVSLYEEIAGRSSSISMRTLDLLDPSDQIELVHQGAVALGVLPPRSSSRVVLDSVEAIEAARRAVYRPGAVFDGPVRLVVSSEWDASDAEGGGQPVDAAVGWSPFAPRLVVHRSEASHVGMLRRPAVDAWAGLVVES